MLSGALISPEGLASRTVPSLLVDARPGEGSFASEHLEGAVHADLNRCLSTASDPGFDPSKGGRHPLPSPHEWAVRLGNLGIGPETIVVVYDDASGGNGACRFWWMLRAFGHTEVAVLDGGLAGAKAAGMKTAAGSPPAVPPLPPYPCSHWIWSLAEIQAVETFLMDASRKVLDVRSRDRWRGEVEAIDPVAGRIPGTINLPFSDNLEPDGRYKSGDQLRQMYLDLLGGTAPDHLTVHCGSGVSACHTLLALELAGLHGAALYVGSFSEWCRSGKPLGKG